MEPELTASEIEFFVEQQPITIVPNFELESLMFISGTFGPFTPQRPAEVPIWLALYLKKRRKCRIQPPTWLDHEVLALKVEEEKQFSEFASLNDNYLEIATLLFKHAKDDIPEFSKVRTLIEDLVTRRNLKIRHGMKDLNGEMPGIQLNNISQMELQNVRRILTEAMTTMNEIRSYNDN